MTHQPPTSTPNYMPGSEPLSDDYASSMMTGRSAPVLMNTPTPALPELSDESLPPLPTQRPFSRSFYQPPGFVRPLIDRLYKEGKSSPYNFDIQHDHLVQGKRTGDWRDSDKREDLEKVGGLVSAYAQGLDIPLNNRLRGGKNTRLPEASGGKMAGDYSGVDAESAVRDMDNTFNKHGHSFDRPSYLYRVMNADHLADENLAGKDLYDKGYLSTVASPRALSRVISDLHSRKTKLAVMRIKVPKGERGLIAGQYHPDEYQEVILNRGARLRVIKHTQEPTDNPRNRLHFLDTELIGHE